MINVLRTLARAVTPIVLDIYDRARPESLLPLIARDVQRTGDPTAGKVTVEWWHAFPQLRQWIGDRETQQIFAASLEVNIKPYEITLSIDRGRIDPQGALVDDPRELAEPVVRGFVQGQVDLAAGILRTNAETYDGQDFFDTRCDDCLSRPGEGDRDRRPRQPQWPSKPGGRGDRSARAGARRRAGAGVLRSHGNFRAQLASRHRRLCGRGCAPGRRSAAVPRPGPARRV